METDVAPRNDDSWLAALRSDLPAHAAVIDRLRHAVETIVELRWMEVGCSLGAGRGDEHSDIDAGIGYREPLAADELDRLGTHVVDACGTVLDLLAHRIDGWPEPARRFAVEYDTGVQLDLAVFPATWRTGLIEGNVAIVDKDGVFSRPMVSEHAGPPSPTQAREWVMFGWWAVSDIAKYLQRGSLFEATARINTVRHQALCLNAAAAGIPYPGFGLTSLLDYPPCRLPDGLADTYCRPDDRNVVIAAARAVTALLSQATNDAATTLGLELDTAWAHTAQQRLHEAITG